MAQKITTKTDIPEGDVKAFSVGERTVAVANVGGAFYAFDDVCSHAQCALSGGELEGTTIECPCHGSMFDVTDGSVQNPPATEPVSTFPVTLDGDDLLIEI